MAKTLISEPICPPSPKFFFIGFFLLVIRQCSKLSSYAIRRKTNEPNMKKKKTNFGPQIFFREFYL